MDEAIVAYRMGGTAPTNGRTIVMTEVRIGRTTTPAIGRGTEADRMNRMIVAKIRDAIITVLAKDIHRALISYWTHGVTDDEMAMKDGTMTDGAMEMTLNLAAGITPAPPRRSA